MGIRTSYNAWSTSSSSGPQSHIFDGQCIGSQYYSLVDALLDARIDPRASLNSGLRSGLEMVTERGRPNILPAPLEPNY